MSNSALSCLRRISPNRSSPRNHKIDTITIHCVVGQMSIESLCAHFSNPDLEASCNYSIGPDGRICTPVDEADRSWCTSSWENDNRAITIECASDAFYPYAINANVWKSLIELCADICRRDGIKKLVWSTDKVERYIEVFGGAAWVLFAKEKQAGQLEVYNDINGNLVNLFRCVKYHCGELQREFDWLLSSREQFFDYMAQANMRGLTDIQRAARFFYVVKLSFGSIQSTYATSKKLVDNVVERLAEVKERLRGVNIERKDYADLIRVYDRKTALFYLDPPYVGTEGYYESPFTADDHRRLRASLERIRGRFILSYNDCPEVRELYKGYTIERIERRESLSGCGKNKKQYAEVIIRNY